LDLSPVILAHEKTFELGPVEARPATRELSNGDQVAVLEPRVMQLLVALRRADGAVVSKDDLVQLCWSGRIVGEDAINRVVSRLRHELTNIAGDALQIETIPKVGYRLRLNGQGQGAPATLATEGRMDRRRLLLTGTAAAGAAALAGLAWQRSHTNHLSPEVDSLMAQGRASMNENTIEQLTNAAAQFRQATALAPDSAEAWGALALTCQLLSRVSAQAQSADYAARGRDATRRALALDPNTGDAVAAQVWAEPEYRNWLNFERKCRQALSRFPTHPMIHEALGGLLSQVGRNREALSNIEQALRFGPRKPVLYIYKGGLLDDVGRIEDSDRTFEEAFRIWPRHYAVWFTRLYHLATYGRPAEALAMLDGPGRPTGIPEWNFAMTRLQVVAMKTRRPNDVQAALNALIDGAHKGVGFAENAIIYAAVVGSADVAFKVADAYYFNRGFAIGERRFSDEQALYTAMSRRHSNFLFAAETVQLRRDPRFNPLVRAIGLEDYWAKSHSKPDYRA
jgi:DNA-binding winged helix-turn-helix (wHTH) protein/tetratricopeptide (TPR) repeat protein